MRASLASLGVIAALAPGAANAAAPGGYAELTYVLTTTFALLDGLFILLAAFGLAWFTAGGGPHQGGWSMVAAPTVGAIGAVLAFALIGDGLLRAGPGGVLGSPGAFRPEDEGALIGDFSLSPVADGARWLTLASSAALAGALSTAGAATRKPVWMKAALAAVVGGFVFPVSVSWRADGGWLAPEPAHHAILTALWIGGAAALANALDLAFRGAQEDMRSAGKPQRALLAMIGAVWGALFLAAAATFDGFASLNGVVAVTAANTMAFGFIGAATGFAVASCVNALHEQERLRSFDGLLAGMVVTLPFAGDVSLSLALLLSGLAGFLTVAQAALWRRFLGPRPPRVFGALALPTLVGAAAASFGVSEGPLAVVFTAYGVQAFFAGTVAFAVNVTVRGVGRAVDGAILRHFPHDRQEVAAIGGDGAAESDMNESSAPR